MKREILSHKRYKHIGGCCPGHDDFPDDTYRNNRSKKARAKGIAAEHRVTRAMGRQALHRTLRDLEVAS